MVVHARCTAKPAGSFSRLFGFATKRCGAARVDLWVRAAYGGRKSRCGSAVRRFVAYTVALNKQPTGDGTVTSDTTAVATVDPVMLPFTTTDWDPAQEGPVTDVDDSEVNAPARTTTIAHEVSGTLSESTPSGGLLDSSRDVDATLLEPRQSNRGTSGVDRRLTRCRRGAPSG